MQDAVEVRKKLYDEALLFAEQQAERAAYVIKFEERDPDETIKSIASSVASEAYHRGAASEQVRIVHLINLLIDFIEKSRE